MPNTTGFLPFDFGFEENPGFLEDQIITYLGNKRSLLGFIERGIGVIIKRTGKKKLDIFDAFSGSGVVARFLKRYAERLIVNDLEVYSEVINRCYLSNISEIPMDKLKATYQQIIHGMETREWEKGIISELYTPSDDQNIQPGERVFYTNRNAAYIDTVRKLISDVDPTLRHFFLAPLLSQASVHANTAGVFKGFYKDSVTGLGKYGGSSSNALARILKDIHLPFPLFSNFECSVEVHRGDANCVARKVGNIDAAYIDPPYNQHPYGSNYFMLNLIVNNTRPRSISRVSGIPADWNRSKYNNRQCVYAAFADLVASLDARFLLISFNSEGFIRHEEMAALLESHGTLDILETSYNTFRASRNLNNRDLYVTEYLYLLEKHA